MRSTAEALTLDEVLDRLTTVCASDLLTQYGNAAEQHARDLRGTAEDTGDAEGVQSWDAVIERIASLRKVRAILGLTSRTPLLWHGSDVIPHAGMRCTLRAATRRRGAGHA